MSEENALTTIYNSFPGISCAYYDQTGKVTRKYYGLADKEQKIPVDGNTVFPACSISKFITAICVMKEYEQDRLDIDKPVNCYLEKWKFHTPEGDESDATVRSLLCHTAGTVDGEDAFCGLRRTDPPIGLIDVLEGNTSYNDRPARAEMIPGTGFEYSDAGYCILQLMLEQLEKKPFEEIAFELLFAPLGLKNTFFASPKNLDDYERRNIMATGYDEKVVAIPGKYPRIPDLAASGLWASPYELLFIGKEFVNAYKGKSSLLTENSAREIAKPVERFPWTGLGVFMGGENEIVTRGWGENGQSMMRINYLTEEIAVVMTNRNPGVDQSESGIEWLINNTMTHKEKALDYFYRKFHCSQSVLAAFAPECGLTEEQALKLGACFGSGALMVLGALYGQYDKADPESRIRANEVNDKMMDGFSKVCGSYICNDLLKCDVSTPEGYRYCFDNNLFTEFCPKMVANAVDVLEKIIEEMNTGSISPSK